MALRLIEMVLRERDGVEVRELLKHHKLPEHRQIRLVEGEVLVRILLDGEERARRFWMSWSNTTPARKAIAW
jgi:hypothetical protein